MSSNRIIKLEKNDVLFREGDSSESMYLIKSGRLAIIKSNAGKDKEMILSEKVHGELLGEMAFFDNLPRSAGAKALVTTEVIELPFKSLQEQFQEAPMWLKVMVKTIVNQVRKANIRIRNLENITNDTYDKIAPSTLLSVCAVMHLLIPKSGKNKEGQPVLTYKDLYFYARQIFSEESQKIKRIMLLLQELKVVTLQDTGEAPAATVIDPATLDQFVEWFTNHMAKSDAERVVFDTKEVSTLNVLSFYLTKAVPEKDGYFKLNLDEVQKSAAKDTGVAFSLSDIDALAQKGAAKDRAVQDGINWTWVKPDEIRRWARFWAIIDKSTLPFGQ